MKKLKIIISVILLIMSADIFVYIYNKENGIKLELKRQQEEKDNFKVSVTLIDKNTISFGEEINLKDYIKTSNVTFDDKKVLFEEFGIKEVSLDYTDPYDRKGTYSFTLEVVDDVKPVILAGSTYIALQGRENSLLEGVVCADYVSSNVKCEVEGEYDLDKIGEYKLKYKATDEKGNYATEDFTLKVVDYKENNYNPKWLTFEEIYNEFKTDKTLVGIDVSEWQGDIDFEKVKNAGVEFVIIRLGAFYYGKHHIDENYEVNIENAKKAGLKIGLYYYSEAVTKEEAISCAEFVKEHLNTTIDLPIAYDWEDWNNYNSYKLSIYDFDQMTYAFLNKIEEYGYDSMIYGSVNYLESMYKPKDYRIWTAQYYKENQYEGKSYMWQRTSTGLVDGIDGAVDVDILYLD